MQFPHNKHYAKIHPSDMFRSQMVAIPVTSRQHSYNEEGWINSSGHTHQYCVIIGVQGQGGQGGGIGGGGG